MRVERASQKIFEGYENTFYHLCKYVKKYFIEM